MLRKKTTYTFYQVFWCHICDEPFCVAVEKHADEIPEKHRARVIKEIKQGKKFEWTIISDDEASELERITCCPNGTSHGVEIIWPIGD